jgi:hypothetical protein
MCPINRNFTSDEWEKLKMCGGVAYIHQRREFLANRSGSGRFDGCAVVEDMRIMVHSAVAVAADMQTTTVRVTSPVRFQLPQRARRLRS